MQKVEFNQCQLEVVSRMMTLTLIESRVQKMVDTKGSDTLSVLLALQHVERAESNRCRRVSYPERRRRS